MTGFQLLSGMAHRETNRLIDFLAILQMGSIAKMVHSVHSTLQTRFGTSMFQISSQMLQRFFKFLFEVECPQLSTGVYGRHPLNSCSFPGMALWHALPIFVTGRGSSNHPWIVGNISGGFLKWRYLYISHPFYFRIFHEINHPAIGVAPWLRKPPITDEWD